jgi:hypothetical protein
MQHRNKVLVPAVLTLLLPNTLQAAESHLLHELGTRHRFVQPEASSYPAAGCIDHRSLMFVVSETEGDDPAIAKLLVARDCRPLVPDAEYIRCGPGGWAYPAKGERLSYASYCRVGAKDIALYALDEQMKQIGESQSPPR